MLPCLHMTSTFPRPTRPKLQHRRRKNITGEFEQIKCFPNIPTRVGGKTEVTLAITVEEMDAMIPQARGGPRGLDICTVPFCVNCTMFKCTAFGGR